MSMSRFITLWTHPDHAPEPVMEDKLAAAEGVLKARLPSDYREAILEFGLPRPTIALLDTICDRNLDLDDVSDFFSPQDIVAHTEDWRDLGLPEELIAFANDCMGNLFCFAADPSNNSEQPVFLWDHDDKSVETVAPSFTRWIENYCSLSAH